MYLSLFVSLFFIASNVFAQECLVSRDVDNYQTKKLVIDDVAFHLHFPKNRPWFTQKVIQTLKEDIPKANQYFNSRPKSHVHLITVGASRANGFDSNGMATVFPYNIITLNEYPPIAKNYLKGTDEWVRNLVLHEYIHILTMDMTNGWIDSLRTLFGSVVKTNGVLPRWLIEGVAVWFESSIPGQGRLNQRGVQYQVYKALTDKDFCQGISCLDAPLKYPYGHAPYWVGGEFVKYLEEINPGFLRCVFTEHSYYFPFFLNRIFKTCINMDVSEAYKDFKQFYIKSHKFLDNFCPADKKVCNGLRKNKIDETIIDYQRGTCSYKNYILYIKRDELGRNRLSTPHRVELLNTTNGHRSTFLSDYPVDSLEMIKNKCVLRQSLFQGCSSTQLFSEIKIPSLHTEILNESTALGIEIDNHKNIVEVHYADGKWDYKHQGKIVKTLYGETRPKFNSEIMSKTRSEIEINSENYSGAQYFTPEYFMFNYSNFANLSAINLNTALVDPLKAHNIGISVTDYFDDNNVNVLGGNLFYNYRKNDWSLAFNAYRAYFINSFDQELSDIEEGSVSFRNFYERGVWSLSNSYRLSSGKRDDFISQRDVSTMSFRIDANQVKNKIYRKDQSKSYVLEVSYTQAESTEKEDYLGLYGYLNHTYNLSKDSLWGISLTHGKFFKDDLKGGYHAAGGVDNYFGSGYPYPLYMLSYADLIGNEITTSSFSYTTNLKDHYRGFGLFPFFMKNSGLTLGTEYAKGKYFFTVNDLYTNEYLTGVFVRYFLNTKLAYIWDSRISLAFSQMQYPTRINRLLILFDAASF